MTGVPLERFGNLLSRMCPALEGGMAQVSPGPPSRWCTLSDLDMENPLGVAEMAQLEVRSRAKPLFTVLAINKRLS
jgi:hypothetical protein